MTTRNSVKNIYSKVRNQGFKKTIVDFLTLLYDYYFDIKNGLDTVSWYSIVNLTKENEVAKHAVLYQGTKVLPLTILLKKLDIKEDDVFVDIGSGKGRVLMIASKYGFKKVKGIEFSEFLSAIAKDNIEKFQAENNFNTDFEIINIDAAKYKIGYDENVFFMYNPFDEFIMEKVLNNIMFSIEKNKREVLIIYVNPIHRIFLENTIKPKKVTNYNLWNLEVVVYNI